MTDEAATKNRADQPSAAPAPGVRGLRRGCGCLAWLVLLAVAIAGWAFAYHFALHAPRPELEEAVDEVAEALGTSREAIELSGQGDLHFDRFAVHDRQGHTVLEVAELRGNLDLAALRDGIFRLREGVASGVTLTLRRGPSGKISLAEVFQPPPVGEDEAGGEVDRARAELRLEVEPVRLRNVTVRVEVAERPLVFAVHSARMSMRTGPEGGHRIRIFDLRGQVIEPDVFPQPVRIVDAQGSVRLGYGHLVDLKARMCIGRGEIRTRIVLPARRRPIDLNVDSRGVLGAMARLGVVIAAARHPERIRATRGDVQMDEGLPCTRADGLSQRESEEPDGLRPVHERRLERRERRRAGETASRERSADDAIMGPSRLELRREERSRRRAERRAERNGGSE